LDWNPTAAYTIFESTGDDWTVTERRIEYERQIVAEGLRSSGYYTYTPVWSDIMERELMTGKDFFYPFVRHLMTTGLMLGQPEFPVDNKVWSVAVETWDPDRL